MHCTQFRERVSDRSVALAASCSSEAKERFLPVLQGVKLGQTQCLTTVEDREKMKVIPYASSIGSIMYTMLCALLLV